MELTKQIDVALAEYHDAQNELNQMQHGLESLDFEDANAVEKHVKLNDAIRTQESVIEVNRRVLIKLQDAAVVETDHIRREYDQDKARHEHRANQTIDDLMAGEFGDNLRSKFQTLKTLIAHGSTAVFGLKSNRLEGIAKDLCLVETDQNADHVEPAPDRKYLQQSLLNQKWKEVAATIGVDVAPDKLTPGVITPKGYRPEHNTVTFNERMPTRFEQDRTEAEHARSVRASQPWNTQQQ